MPVTLQLSDGRDLTTRSRPLLGTCEKAGFLSGKDNNPGKKGRQQEKRKTEGEMELLHEQSCG